MEKTKKKSFDASWHFMALLVTFWHFLALFSETLEIQEHAKIPEHTNNQ